MAVDNDVMLHAILLLAKITLVVLAAAWIADVPGTIDISWQEYDIRAQLGVFLVVLLALLIVSLIFANIIRFIVSIPQKLHMHFCGKRWEKGYRAITVGFASVASGDQASAARQAKLAEWYLPKAYGLPLFLKAQSAMMRGDLKAAEQSFYGLLDYKDAAFLGVRGLMQVAAQQEDHEKALVIGYKALGLFPKHAWILYMVYRLELRLKRWAAAQKTLLKIAPGTFMDSMKIRDDSIAIKIMLSELSSAQGKDHKALSYARDAYKLNREFVPSALHLTGLYLKMQKRREAVRLLQEIWKTNPHQDLVTLWMQARPIRKNEKHSTLIHWLERLNKINPENIHGHLALARLYMIDKLWGEARAELMNAEDHGTSPTLYALRADLESQTGGAASLIADLKERAVNMNGVPRWICKQTGRIYSNWQAVAEPHGAFNTIVWDLPSNVLEAHAENELAHLAGLLSNDGLQFDQAATP